MRTTICTTLTAIITAAGAVRGAYTVIDLSPPGSTTAQALAVVDGNQAGAADVGGNLHAYLWSGAAPGSDLHPAGYESSLIFGLSTTQAAGLVFDAGTPHAALWTPGAPTPFQLLNDSGYADSEATAIVGSTIVGLATAPASGGNPGGSRALVWSNPAAAPVNLHPATATYANTGIGYITSSAAATDGTYAVGTADLDNATNDPHAALWNLANQAFTDLHPSAGFLSSSAAGIGGSQIVGYGLQDNSVPNPATHALLWTLSEGSGITLTDLHPAGFTSSYASATNGSLQVGYGVDADGNDHALLWAGTAQATDLSQWLPAEMYVSSEAYGIDSAGDIVGDATDTAGITHAILWSAGSTGTPEPASLLLIAPALFPFFRRSARHSGARR